MRRWFVGGIALPLLLAGCSLQLPPLATNLPVPGDQPSVAEPAQPSAPAWTPPKPTITGNPNVGQTLTVDAGDWGNATLAYQWYQGDTAIKKATKSTYVPSAADYGQTVSVEVKGTGLNDVATTAQSDPSATIGRLMVNKQLIGRIGSTFADLSDNLPGGIEASGTYGGVSRWHEVDNVRIVYWFNAPKSSGSATPDPPDGADKVISVYAPGSMVFTGFPGEMSLDVFLKVSGATNTKTQRTTTLGRITTFKLSGQTWMLGAVTKVSPDTPFTVGDPKIH